MLRHRRRNPALLASKNYIKPSKLTPAYDRWGMRIPGEFEREELPAALFAPGATDESDRLSEVAQHKGQMFWHQRVEVESTDTIEIPGQGAWSVAGHPSHWPQGTVVVLERAT